MLQNTAICRTITVPAIGNGYRLDALLSAYLKLSDTEAINEALGRGLAFAQDGSLMTGSIIVDKGQKIQLMLKEIQVLTPPPSELEILFENEALIAVNKPAGLLVHPAGGLFQWTVLDIGRLTWSLHDLDLCHRLDRETSGVLLLSKARRYSPHIKMQFESRQVDKTYRAYVLGRPDWSTIECNARIRHAEDDRRVRRSVHPNGLESLTRFRMVSQHRDYAVIECVPITGRSHQIRVHLAQLGHPILGDALYPSINDTKTRHALHCAGLTFTDHQGTSVTVEAPIPNDMLALLDHHCESQE